MCGVCNGEKEIKKCMCPQQTGDLFTLAAYFSSWSSQNAISRKEIHGILKKPLENCLW